MRKPTPLCKCCSMKYCLKKKGHDEGKGVKAEENVGKGVGKGTGLKIQIRGRRRRGRPRGLNQPSVVVSQGPGQNLTFAHLPVFRDLFTPQPAAIREAIAPLLSEYLRQPNPTNAPALALADERRVLEPQVESRRPSIFSLMSTPRIEPLSLRQELETGGAAPPRESMEVQTERGRFTPITTVGTAEALAGIMRRRTGKPRVAGMGTPATPLESALPSGETFAGGGATIPTVQARRKPKVAPEPPRPGPAVRVPSDVSEEKSGEE